MRHAPRGRSVILLAALTFASRAAAGDPDPTYFRMKLARVVDAHGFEKPITALTLLVPTDWTVQGGVAYDVKNGCTATLARLSFRAASPDGRVALELLPSDAWSWSDDAGTRTFLEQDRQTKARYGLKACEIGPPLAAKDYLAKVVVPRARPGAHVLGVDVDRDADKAAHDLARSIESQLSKVGVPARVRADTARVHIARERNGQRQEEWLTAMAYSRATPAPTFDPRTGRMGQALSYACGADHVFAASAPEGRLLGNERLFRAILGTVRVDPAWQARVQQAQANIEATNTRGAAERSKIIARSAEDTRKILRETYEHRQASQDRSAERFSQALRGVETFRNPRTGETVELSNQYGNAWTNGKNEYLLSDSSSFDPNSVSRESWTRLEHVAPGR